ncbi:UxaA family hydrolase [Oribacterium sp. WCC10]|uniref:UxaA family hydrolase n=1 Tax=Oribacterium sp. WCC10 TaxID=1855343 RepID=UPI0008E97F0F|nr:UxaA family hydrolase [Oribacterium sp. WCC10]SFG77544.1 galactarate dehydratase [Oribacterium sp. WCC10]
MTGRLCIRITDRDNVAIAIHDVPKGTEVMSGVVTQVDIPQAHKIALEEMKKGTEVYRYGVCLGTTSEDIPKGGWINERNLIMAPAPDLDSMKFGVNIRTDLPRPKRTTWMGYRNPSGFYAGTRNILGINTTVQCVAGVLNVAIKKIKEEILPKYPNVDDVVAVNHPYGCGVAIDAPDAYIPQKIIRNIAMHPNFGGVFMLVGLGCEKFTVDRFCEWWPELNTKENVIILQENKGYQAMMDAIIEMAEKKLQILNERRREELPLSELLVGMQCGGSDAFSGITANPTAGYAADLLVSGGGTAMFSEVTEVRDGVQFIAERCINDEVGKRLVQEMKWYDEYLRKGGVDRGANTTPGNKKGGLSNIIEKSMGSIAKSGSSPIMEVLSPGDRPTKHGEIFAATPASDLVCGPSQLASGMGLEVFMTGRGTPYGLAAAPVIKLCSRNEMKEQWSDIIDFNAGPAAVGDKTIAEQGEELFDFILDVASGIKRPFTEQYGFANDLCVFNPAPIT